MNKKSLRRAAVIAAAGSALAAGLLTPAQAARGTVVIHETNVHTGFNPDIPNLNLVTNVNGYYLRFSNFTYYNDSRKLIANSTFGSYKVVTNKKDDFRVQVTIKPGRVWSDGTPITAEDLLLYNVICNREYAKAAGLGNYSLATGVTNMDFKATCLASSYYALFNAGDPILSDDKMSLTWRYKQRIPDWDINLSGVYPVHAYMHIIDGKTSLQSVAANEAARADFVKAYNSKDTKTLKAIGKIWSTDYTITTVNPSAATYNPLMWVSNGGFLLDRAVAGQSMTFKANPRYNSGPAVTGQIDNIVFRYVTDGTPAIQALENREIDIYAGQPTADGIAALRKVKGVNLEASRGATYEHIMPRYGSSPGQTPYTGVFAGSGAKATDLRRAFLLCVPRQEILDKLILPMNPNMEILNTRHVMPTDSRYSSIVAANGSKYYMGSQASLNNRAMALIRKHVPNAASDPIKLTMLVPGNNQRRGDQALLIKANVRKCGFDVTLDTQAAWGTLLSNGKYDVVFFGWQSSSTAQAPIYSHFIPGGGSNFTRVDAGPALNIPLERIYGNPLSDKVLQVEYIKIDRALLDQGITLTLFQHPAFYAWDTDLKGIKPRDLGPTIVWNYWEWRY